MTWPEALKFFEIGVCAGLGFCVISFLFGLITRDR